MWLMLQSCHKDVQNQLLQLQKELRSIETKKNVQKLISTPTFVKVSAEQVAFQPDSTTFLDEAAARAALNGLAEQLKGTSAHYIVAGSTAQVDNASSEGAQALSLARAQAVRDVLVEAGVPADRFTCLGLGNEPTSARSANEPENRCTYVVADTTAQAAEFLAVGQAES